MSPNKPRVLCVDDDNAILKSLERVLSSQFSPVLAKSLKEARDLFLKEDFAIVIVDQTLPSQKLRHQLPFAKIHVHQL